MACSLNECYTIFEINDIDNISIDELKKIYHKLCLKHHPDKTHKDTKQTFLHIKECYSFLLEIKDKRQKDNSNNNDKHTNFDVYEYLISLLNVENLQKVWDWISMLNDSKNIINLHVSLNQLFKKELYIHEQNMYIPLWYKSITESDIILSLSLDEEDSDKIFFIHIKDLPSYVRILENNDIVIYSKDTHKFLNKKIKINICKCKSIEINITKKILQDKYYIFNHEGIPRINKDNIYDISDISNIILCLC